MDFGLCRFREYLVGSQHEVKVISDHKPLVPIFNKNRKGSIQTQRIKLRHQDILYVIEYREGKLNQADHISRHAKPLSTIPKPEQEADELNNLLYALHTTPIVDHIGLSTIANETSKDPTLTKIKKYVKEGQRWIPKGASPEARKFQQILPELTLTGNGILLKGDRMVLPSSLHCYKAIELAHKGAHPGQSDIERRLRFHFFFYNMYVKMTERIHCPYIGFYLPKNTRK